MGEDTEYSLHPQFRGGAEGDGGQEEAGEVGAGRVAEILDPDPDFRLSLLVTDLQQAMLSSRSQSVHHPTPQRRLYPSCDPFYWHQHSSASQPARRTSEQSSRPSLKTGRRTEYLRRSSCFSRLGGLPPNKLPRSLSQMGDTIEEGKESPSPVKCAVSSTQADGFLFSESFSSLELRQSSGLLDSFTELKKFKYRAIPSSSTKFSDI